MAAPTSGPCNEWIEPEDVIACCSGISDPLNSTQLAKAITFATSILFRLSGRQFPGECERTLRPCAGDGCGCGGPGWAAWPLGGWSFWVWEQAAQGWSFPSIPFRLDGEWYNSGGGGCASLCDLPAVTLPAPVSGIAEVVIDGVLLDPAVYAVEGYKKLVRLDGLSWPCVQDRSKESGLYVGPNDGSRDNTWQLTYTYGRGPGPDGVIATAAYACELAKWLCNADDCELPARVKSVNREGVSLDFLDPMDFLDEGKTGVYIVDAWLGSVNPTGAARRSTISRLDGSRRRPRGFT